MKLRSSHIAFLLLACICACGPKSTPGTLPPNACASIDLKTSATNCGKCNHACLGGACVDGRCRPATLAAEPRGNVLSLAADDESVVWFATTGTESSIALELARTGRPKTTLRRFPIGESGTLALDSKHAYVCRTADIVRVPLDGGALETFASNGCQTIQVAAGRVFFDANGSIFVKPVAGGAVRKLVAPEEDNPNIDGFHVMTDGAGIERLYFARGGAIHRRRTDAGPTEKVADAQFPQAAWTVASASVFLFEVYTSYGGKRIADPVPDAPGIENNCKSGPSVGGQCPNMNWALFEVPLAAGKRVERSPSELWPHDAHAEGEHVYWAIGGVYSMNTSIRRMPLDAGPARTIVGEPWSPGAWTVTPARVVWHDTEAHAIVSLAK